MGKAIIIQDANFIYKLSKIITFDLQSDNVSDINYDSNNDSLQLKNSGSSGDFNWIASTGINSVKITMPSDSAVSRNAFVIGTDSNGDALVFYLDGAIGIQAGYIFIFPKTGVVTSLVDVYTASNIPQAPKGTEITFTKISGGVNVSYTGYSHDILNADITGYATTGFGVLATGTSVSDYLFEVS